MSLQNSPSGTPKNLPGTPNVGPGTPNVGPGTPNVGPGTPNVGPGTPNVGPGTPNVGPGTGPGSLPGTPGAPGVGPGTPGTPNKHSRFPVGVKEVKDLTDIRGVLNNPAVFRTTYEKDLKDLTGGYGYLLGIDNEDHHEADHMMTMFALIPDKQSLQQYATFYRTTAEWAINRKLSKREESPETNSIDIVQDVINVTCTRWVCEMITGIPLGRHGTEADVFNNLSIIHSFIFRKLDTHKTCGLRDAALKASQDLWKVIETQLEATNNPMPKSFIGNFIHTVISPPQNFKNYVARIFEEYWWGKEVKPHSPHRFLRRFSKASGVFQLPDSVKESLKKELSEGDEALEKRRIVANLLGLCVMASVSYAQVCARAVHFYLDPKHAKERATIDELLKSNAPGLNAKIMYYIRQAQEHHEWPDIFRRVASSSQHFHQGDRVVLNFDSERSNLYHTNDLSIGFKTPYIQGMGLHRCPGINFVQETMPEIFKAIFKLKDLKRVPGQGGELETSTIHDANPSDPSCLKIAVPNSLVVQYNPKHVKRGLIKSGIDIPKWKNKLDNALALLLSLVLLYRAIFHLISLLPCPNSICGSSPQDIPSPEPQDVSCKPPTIIFQPWEIKTIFPGQKGKPIPIAYTTTLHRSHRLSIVDIDARDMQLQVFIDGVLNASTTDFELDRSVNCREDVKRCFEQRFSSAVVTVPPGMHTVEVAWSGKEFLPGTNEINWGKDKHRRFKWMREYCA